MLKKKLTFIFLGVLLTYGIIGSVIIPCTLQWILIHKVSPFLNHTIYVRKIHFNPFQFRFTMQQFELVSPSGTRMAGFEGLDIDFRLSSLWGDSWAFKHIFLDQPYINIALNRDGRLNLLDLMPAPKTSSPAESGTPSAPPEQQIRKENEDSNTPKPFLISNFSLTNGAVYFSDETPQTPFKFSLRPINTRVEHVTTQTDKASGLQIHLLNGSQGTIAIQGACSIGALACHTTVDIQAIPLNILQPYIAHSLPLQLKDGTVSLNGEISYRAENQSQPNVGFKGHLRLTGLKILDPQNQLEVLGWEDLLFHNINVSLLTQSLTIDEILLDKVSVSTIMDPKGQINLARLFSPTPPASSQTEQKPAPSPPGKPGQDDTATAPNPAFQFLISRVRVQNGAISFTDESVTPHFNTNLSSLNLTLSPLSQESGQRTDFDFNTRLNQTGTVIIKGYVHALNIDADKNFSLSVQDYDMTSLSPYFGKYLGYTIDLGRLKTDINYDIKPQQMAGNHHLVLNKFTLGNRVDSPDAVNVPIKLALAILEDSRQQIDLAVPVKGNPAEPEFEFKQIILMAFKNIFTKIITAPFSVLTGLVPGSDASEPLDYIGFPAGSAKLTGPQKEKALKISQALQDRPKLILEIQGAYDPQNDMAALRLAAFQNSYAEASQESSKSEEVILEQMYKKYVGWIPLTELRDKYRQLAREGQNRTENKDAFYEELHKQLVERYQVETAVLKDLGNQRAEALKALLIKDGGLPEARLQIKTSISESESADHLVKIPLSLTAQ
ncbi:MAG TPA: DUF748 domain-containing protein [Candidatus Omnitrophota bacterium]|nr:DUF748 domain-containing protein [Candidatus Omnitrophota bacterium]